MKTKSKKSKREPVKSLTKAQVLELARKSAAEIGLTLKEFQDLDDCDRNGSLAGCNANMLLSLIKYNKKPRKSK